MLITACCAGTVSLVGGCGIGPLGESSSPAATGAQGAVAVHPDPCALLTHKQLELLRLSQGQQQSSDDGLSCTWYNYPLSQGSGVTARLTSGPVAGAGSAPSIAGYPTQEVVPPGVDPRSSCVYLLAVAPNQVLWAQYTNPRSRPGVTHQTTCQKAQAAAATLASTYRSLPR